MELWEDLHLALAVCVCMRWSLFLYIRPGSASLDEKKEKMTRLRVDTRYVAGASLSSFWACLLT